MEVAQKTVEQSKYFVFRYFCCSQNGLLYFKGLDSSFELDCNKEPLSFAVKQFSFIGHEGKAMVSWKMSAQIATTPSP